MKKILILIICITPWVAQAADFTINLSPAPNSITDNEVNQISSSKVQGLGALSSKSLIQESDISGTININKILGLGLLSSKSSIQESDISGTISSAKILGLGSLSSKSSIQENDIIGTISAAKILGLGPLSFKSTIQESDISGTISSSKILGLGPYATKTSLLDTDIQGLGPYATKASLLSTDIQGLGPYATKTTLLNTDIQGLGPYATKTVLQDTDIPLLTISKISDAGVLASKNKVGDAEINDASISTSKIINFATQVISAMTSTLNNYLLKSSIPSCLSNQRLSYNGTSLVCQNESLSSLIEISTTYNASSQDETIIVDSSSSAITINLPSASANTGKKYNISLKVASNYVTIDPNAAETVCDKSTIMLSGKGDGISIQSNGTKWIGLGGGCIRTLAGLATGATDQSNCPANSACTLTRQQPQGAYVNATSNANGNITVTFKTGTFSSTPSCVCSGVSWGTAFRACYPIESASSVNLTITTANDGSGVVGSATFHCTGDR